MAGPMPVDNSEVQTATELLKSHATSLVKQHLVLDAQGRQFLVFTAYIGAGENDPCLATEYIYPDITSTQIIGRQERAYKWKAAWDSGFTFDPTANYDPDGDGDL